MKNFPIVLAVAFVGLFFTSCDEETIKPSAEITTLEKNITGFNALEVASDFEVFITFSETEEKIEVTANENLQDLISIEKNGKTLEISFKNNVNISGNETSKIYITTKEIIDYRVAGDATVQLENELATDNIKMDLAGDSQFTGTLDVKNVTAQLAGDVSLNLDGQADEFELKIGGDAKVKDYDFVCQKLDVNMGGDCEVFLTVMQTIDVSAAGESVLHFKGTGEITNQSTTGEAKVIKED